MDAAKQLLDQFSTGVQACYGGQPLPDKVINLLKIMIHMDEEDVITSLRLFHSLQISLEQFVEVYDLIKDLQNDFIEAKEVIEKVEKMMRAVEILDEEEIELTTNSIDSGYQSGMEMEDSEEEEGPVMTKDQRDAVNEMMVKAVGGALKFGDDGLISEAISLVKDSPIPAAMFKKYEIVQLLQLHGSASKDAQKLLKRLQNTN